MVQVSSPEELNNTSNVDPFLVDINMHFMWLGKEQFLGSWVDWMDPEGYTPAHEKCFRLVEQPCQPGFKQRKEKRKRFSFGSEECSESSLLHFS